MCLGFYQLINTVTAPAGTGSDNNSSRAVMATDHSNRGGIRSGFTFFFCFMLIVVEMQFTDPRTDDTLYSITKWPEKNFFLKKKTFS